MAFASKAKLQTTGLLNAGSADALVRTRVRSTRKTLKKNRP